MKPSRTKSLFSRLQKAVDMDLRKIKNPDKKDIDRCGIIIEKFGEKTGWLHKQKHTGTLVSFCLGVVERSDFNFNSKITGTLNDII